MSGNWKEVVAEWQDGMKFHGQTAKGAQITYGSAGEGEDPLVGPMEMLLLGVAGCTGMDVVSILQKKRQPLSDLQVKVRGKRADTYPQVYTEIEVTYLLWGNGLEDKAIQQAIQLSEEKYCSAAAMMSSVARITSSYQVFPVSEHLEAQ